MASEVDSALQLAVAATKKFPYKVLAYWPESQYADSFMVVGSEGNPFEVEREAFWDDRSAKSVRMVIKIRPIGQDKKKAVSVSFIVAPNGQITE